MIHMKIRRTATITVDNWPGGPTVGRAHKGNIQGIDHIRIGGMNPYLSKIPAETPSAVTYFLVRVSIRPGSTKICRFKQTPVLISIRVYGIDQIGIGLRYCQSDPPDIFRERIWQTVGRAQIPPGIPAIQRAIDTTGGAKEMGAVRAAHPFPHGQHHSGRISRVHNHIDGTGRIRDKFRKRPGLTSIFTPVKPPLRVRIKVGANRRDKNPLGISGIDHNPANRSNILQTEKLPGGSTVRGFIYPTTREIVVAAIGLTGTHIQRIGIDRVNTDIAHIQISLIVEYRKPGEPHISGLEHAPGCRTGIDDIGIFRIEFNIRETPADIGRTSKLHLHQFAIGRLGPHLLGNLHLIPEILSIGLPVWKGTA